MVDNTEVTYLRLSVTDRCNLRCLYCASTDARPHLPRAEILGFEEMVRVVSLLARRGVRAVRITGGEPLMKRRVVDLVQMLSAVDGITDLSMTTNGLLLGDHAQALKKAGLRRINVSLDTLDSDRYKILTGSEGLERVLQGISQALRHGLSPVKLNAVVLKGVNEDEVCDFIRFGAEHGVVVRFIEYMPMGRVECDSIPTSVIRATIEREFGPMEPISLDHGEGPAEYFAVRDIGTVGFISPMSGDPCSSCNRLRLRADGRMYPCLLRSAYVDLKGALRGESSDHLETLFDLAIALKHAGTRSRRNPERFPMCVIGG